MARARFTQSWVSPNVHNRHDNDFAQNNNTTEVLVVLKFQTPWTYFQTHGFRALRLICPCTSHGLVGGGHVDLFLSLCDDQHQILSTKHGHLTPLAVGWPA